MSSCFSFLKSRQSLRDGPRSAPTRPTSASVSTSHSDDSVSGKQTTSKSTTSTSSQRRIPALYKERSHNLRVFDYNELLNTTNDFSRAAKLGKGGFGSVYKGFIRPSADGKGDRLAVAVKKLNQHGLQGHKQWLAEVQFLGVVEHPNLLKRIGYCTEDGERGIQRIHCLSVQENKDQGLVTFYES